jgi:hypothetical protein
VELKEEPRLGQLGRGLSSGTSLLRPVSVGCGWGSPEVCRGARRPGLQRLDGNQPGSQLLQLLGESSLMLPIELELPVLLLQLVQEHRGE